MDLPVPVLTHPERPFGPREPRVAAAAGRGDRGEHTAGLQIDLLDAIPGELKQVVSIFTDPEQQALARKKETLPQGMTKDEADLLAKRLLYKGAIVYQVTNHREDSAGSDSGGKESSTQVHQRPDRWTRNCSSECGLPWINE